MRARSEIAKPVREANRRRQLFKNRRFNDPLKLFIERKHPTIFMEYVEFYKYLDQLNPTRKDLVKSSTFKDWMKSNPLTSPHHLTEFPPHRCLEPQLTIPLFYLHK